MVEAVNGSKKTFTGKEKIDRMKMAISGLMTIPGPKMMWQFGELGYDISINENGRTGGKPIRWDYEEDAERLKLFKVYQHLGSLKASKSIFNSNDFTVGSLGIIKRNSIQKDNEYLIYLANPDVSNQNITTTFPQKGIWYDYFTGKSVELKKEEVSLNLLPGEFHLLTNVQWNSSDLGLVPWNLPDMNILANRPEDEVVLSVFPNPNEGKFTLRWNGNANELVKLEITDTFGRIVSEKYVLQQTGTNEYYFFNLNVTSGLYFVQLNEKSYKIVIN